MKRKDPAHPVLWYQIAGFCALIATSWLDELFAASLFGWPHEPNIREGLFESALLILVAIPTVLFTRRVVRRLFYLEGFLNVCGWCGNIEHGGSWIPVSDFFKKRFEVETSHGMCPTCFVAKFGTAALPQGS